jgi:hypothetical protein
MTQARRSLLSLVVLVLVAVALGGIALRSHQQEQGQKAAEEKSAQLFDFDPAQVSGLTLEAHGEQTVLVREGPGFKLLKPLETDADADAVTGVLQRLRALRRKSEVEGAPTDLAKYGLDHPTARLTVTLPTGTQGIALGAANTFSGSQYAQLAGSGAVIQVEGSHDAMLARTSFDLRDKHLVRLDAAKVQRLSVDAPPDHFVLERRGDGWQLVEPVPMAADDGAVQQLLAVFENARAEAFVSGSEIEAVRSGFASPMARITATLADQQTVELDFAEASPAGTKQLFAHANHAQAVAQVAAGSMQPLHVSLEALEDKTLARVEPERIASMQFGEGQQAIVLKRERAPDGGPSASWIELAPHAGKVKPEVIEALLALIGNLRGNRRVPGKVDLHALGLQPPERRFTVQGASGEVLASVLLGSARDGAIPAQREGDARVFTVETARLASLPENPDALLEPLDGGR